MDDDYDLKDFSNVGRLFPLPGVVLFPHAVLPLHIFEPRYRQMTEDALATDRMITIVQIRPPSEWLSPSLPALERIGCIGRIFKHERMPDGRFNFLLLGRKRVELTNEIQSGKLYRMSELKIIEDIAEEDADESHRIELIASFRRFYKGTLDPDLDALFESELPLGVLTDIMSQAMSLPSSIKQNFLAQPRVDQRVMDLIRHLKDLDREDNDQTTTFPPPFSRN